MFHLFNKTYLHIEPCIDTNENRIVISKENGHQMLQVLEQISFGRLYAAGKQVSDIVGPDKTYTNINDMFEFCLNFNKTTNKRIVIYCDQESFMTIVSIWFKTIFVDITVDAAYNIVKGYFSKLVMLGGRDQAKSTDMYREFIFNKLEFWTVFNSVTLAQNSSSILEKIAGFRSVEYLVGSYLYNDSHKEELKEKLFLIVNRNIQDILEDLWKHFQENALLESFQQAQGLQNYNFDNILEIFNDPALQSLKSTNAWTSLSEVGDSTSSTNLTVLTPSQIAQIKAQLVQFSVSNEIVYQRYLTYIDIAHRGYILDEEIEKILLPQYHPTFQYEWWGRKDIETINIFLLMFFANEIEKQRHRQTLQSYVLK
jgi:hypothetical protein